jgi:hypothetical protein
LKSRPADGRDDEIARMRTKVGELTMDNQLLNQRCRADRPFSPRRRRRQARPSPPPPDSAMGWPASDASGSCPARRFTSGAIRRRFPSNRGRNPSRVVFSAPAQTRTSSATSAVS